MTSDLCHLAFEGFCTSFCLIMVKSSASSAPTIHGLQQGRGKPQYISLKKVCESNKANSQAQTDGFYLCHRELRIS